MHISKKSRTFALTKQKQLKTIRIMERNNETLCAIKGTFGGLYFWGDGWLSMYVARNWQKFWDMEEETPSTIFWHVSKRDDTYYLVSTEGSIYLHPMGFRSVLVSCGGKSNGKYFGNQINELIKLCNKCVQYCGGTFTLQTSEETKVELNYID